MKLRNNQKAQGLVEYALILVLIAIVVIVILSLLGTRVSEVFSQINSGLGLSGIGGGGGATVSITGTNITPTSCFGGTCSFSVQVGVTTDQPAAVNVTVSGGMSGSASATINSSGTISVSASGTEHGNGQICVSAGNTVCTNISW